MKTIEIINRAERKLISLNKSLELFDSAHLLLTSAFNQRVSMFNLLYLTDADYLSVHATYDAYDGRTLVIDNDNCLIPTDGNVVNFFTFRILQTYTEHMDKNVIPAYEISDKLVVKKLEKLTNVTPSFVFDLCNNGGVIIGHMRSDMSMQTELPYVEQYNKFDFSNIISICEEILRISNLEDINEATLSAVCFQRSYSTWLQLITGLKRKAANIKAIDNIRCIGALNTAIAEKVNCLWDRWSHFYE